MIKKTRNMKAKSFIGNIVSDEEQKGDIDLVSRVTNSPHYSATRMQNESSSYSLCGGSARIDTPRPATSKTATASSSTPGNSTHEDLERSVSSSTPFCFRPPKSPIEYEGVDETTAPNGHYALPRVPDQQDKQEQEKDDKNNMDTTARNISSPEQEEVDAIFEDWVAKGRRGDPRMHRAVAARLAKPELSLFQALVIGGFKFPDYEQKKMKRRDGTNSKSKGPVYDSDNILLSQRKNQLSRRLRFHNSRKMQAEQEAQRRDQEAISNLTCDIQQPAASNGSTLLNSNSYHFCESEGNKVYHSSFSPLLVNDNNKRKVPVRHSYARHSIDGAHPAHGGLREYQYLHRPPELSPLTGTRNSNVAPPSPGNFIQPDLLNLKRQQPQQRQQPQHQFQLEDLEASGSLTGLLNGHHTDYYHCGAQQLPPRTLPSTSHIHTGNFGNARSNLLFAQARSLSLHGINTDFSSVTPAFSLPFFQNDCNSGWEKTTRSRRSSNNSNNNKAMIEDQLQLQLQEAIILHQNSIINELKVRQAF